MVLHTRKTLKPEMLVVGCSGVGFSCREVAAYDNIFPGGYYAAKVRRLAGFKTCTETHCIVQGLLLNEDNLAEAARVFV